MVSHGFPAQNFSSMSNYSMNPKEHRFSPYEDNAGTIVAIAGEDFAVMASDTRLSEGYSIMTRNQPRLFKLSETSVLGMGGCWCDVLTLTRVVDARLKMYEHEHNQPISTYAAARLLATLLYYKRMFPYYVTPAIAGLDKDGKGVVFSYDCIGCIGEPKRKYAVEGASQALILSVLDNQVSKLNMQNVDKDKPISLEDAVKLIKDTFISAAERDIHTGDNVIFNIITKDGIKVETVPLRAD